MLVLKPLLTSCVCIHQNECKRYTQLHPDLQPFEAGSELTLQNYCKKLDTGLFVVASTTKKRPNNLVFGRVFDAQILDMLELGVSEYIPMQKFKHPGGIVGAKVIGLVTLLLSMMPEISEYLFSQKTACWQGLVFQLSVFSRAVIM